MISRFIKKKQVLYCTVPWLLLLLGSWLISNFVVQFMLIQGESMEPTYHSGQLTLVNHMIHEFRPGQVIVFRVEGIPGVVVKRVVGGPGDEIIIIDGFLYCNGERESGNFAQMKEAGIAEEAIVLGAEEYFVLGDNRNNSIDSRFEEIGIIKEEQIKGIICCPHTEEEK